MTMPYNVIGLPARPENRAVSTHRPAHVPATAPTPGTLGAVIHRSERQRTEAATFQLYDGRSRNQLRSSDPEAVLLQDGKPTRQNRTVLLDGGGYDRRLPVWSDSMQTEQQYTGVRTPLPIDEFAEVLVRRDEDRLGLRGATKHFDVRDARI